MRSVATICPPYSDEDVAAAMVARGHHAECEHACCDWRLLPAPTIAAVVEEWIAAGRPAEMTVTIASGITMSRADYARLCDEAIARGEAVADALERLPSMKAKRGVA